ncbi:MAG: polysaccharide biosynthesis/export family protein [Vicinamibacterales bacterium]|nr:polysaccharide biosynthesis/export family protein [Vicinamibacterales bacterium]
MKHSVAVVVALALLIVPVASTAQVKPDTRDYVVGPQDVLRIAVFEEPQLTGSYRVDNDGSFSYPFIGLVPAAGQTLRALEDLIAKRLAEGYLKRAQVTVDVEQYRARNIFIVGEVKAPGKYPLSGAQTTLLEALAQAGYVSGNAGTEILVLKPGARAVTDSALTPEAASDTIRVVLAELQEGRPTANILIREGETIFVPRAEKFYVSGYVRSPGAYVYERGMTLLQALTLAGGVSDKGSTRGIKAQRVVKGEKKDVSLKMTDPILPGDTIVVRQRML